MPNPYAQYADTNPYAQYANDESLMSVKVSPSEEQLKDVGKSIVSAVPRAGATLLDLPRMLVELLSSKHPLTPEQQAQMDAALGPRLTGMANAPTFTQRLNDSGALHDPETIAGKYAGAGTEGLVSGALGGQAGLLPGFLSGIGGEAGSNFGPSGRMVGGIAGSLTPLALDRLFGNNAPQLISKATEGMTPEKWDRAIAAEKASNSQIGKYGLTGPEATQSPQLLALQRNVEGNPASLNTMANYMRERGTQTSGALSSELENIAPMPANPAMTAQNVRDAAAKAIRDERNITNTMSRPDYQATTGNPKALVPDELYSNLKSIPGFDDLIKGVKSADPIVYGNLKNLPDNSYGVLDQAKKFLDAKSGEAVLRNDGHAVGQYGSLKNAITDAMDTADPRYASARNIQRMRQAAVEKPLAAGPIGKLEAQTSPTTSSQFDLLTNPKKDVTPILAGDAAKRLQMNNPQAYQEMLRSGLQQELDNAMSLKGDATRVGEKFVKNVYETPQSAENVKAILGQLPDGEIRKTAFDNLMQTLKLQSQRLAANSATQEKGAFSDFISSNKIANFISAPLKISPVVFRGLNGNTNEQLAKIFTDPNSTQLMRQLAILKPGSDKAAALVNSLLSVSRTENTAPVQQTEPQQ